MFALKVFVKMSIRQLYLKVSFIVFVFYSERKQEIMRDKKNKLTEMMLELDKKNQEVMNYILNQQKEMIGDLEAKILRMGKVVKKNHGFSKEDVRLLWIDEDFNYKHMKKKNR